MECISNIKLNDIIVVNGPGSFTGVRTGVTVAKTLSYLLNIPIKTVSYLEIIDYSLDGNENLVGFYDNSGIFVGKFSNHKLIGNYEYIRKSELNLNELSNLKTDVIIDYSKIYNLISKLPKIDSKLVNPIYVKKISVEYD
jgi:peptidase M22, glycoprotease ydiC